MGGKESMENAESSEESESELSALQRRVEDLEQWKRDIEWSLQDRVIQANVDSKWVLALLIIGWVWQWLI
jgi:hypothetical protein